MARLRGGFPLSTRLVREMQCLRRCLRLMLSDNPGTVQCVDGLRGGTRFLRISLCSTPCGAAARRRDAVCSGFDVPRMVEIGKEPRLCGPPSQPLLRQGA
jgi:hypothetical protein